MPFHYANQSSLVASSLHKNFTWLKRRTLLKPQMNSDGLVCVLPAPMAQCCAGRTLQWPCSHEASFLARAAVLFGVGF